jgi:hypothetical protein
MMPSSSRLCPANASCTGGSAGGAGSGSGGAAGAPHCAAQKLSKHVSGRPAPSSISQGSRSASALKERQKRPAAPSAAFTSLSRTMEMGS